jgi:hypothetical protein
MDLCEQLRVLLALQKKELALLPKVKIFAGTTKKRAGTTTKRVVNALFRKMMGF